MLTVRIALALHLIVLSVVLSTENILGDEPRGADGSGLLVSNVASTEFDYARSTARISDNHSHPLLPILSLAREGYQRFERAVRDYTCTLVKRERIEGRLMEPETLYAKVRHAVKENGEGNNEDQISLYLRFQSPADLQGREVLFQRVGAEDKLLVRNGGQRLAFLTMELKPDCPLAMQGNRYPITEFGIKRLIERTIDICERELAYHECDVTIDQNVSFEERNCTRIEVCHPVRRDHFQYHLARVFIDDRLQLPIRFEAYDWPTTGDSAPQLIEEYTYRDVQLNVGLTDADFDRDHPAYHFRRK